MSANLRWKWLTFSVIILAVGAGWIWLSKTSVASMIEGPPPVPRAGFSAPDFQLDALDGETVSLSGLKGQVVLINFWASWCPPCRSEMPAMEAVHQDYRDLGLVVLAINATNQDDLRKVSTFVSDYALTSPILLDTEGQVSLLYELRSLPTSFFIDREGIIRDVVIGGPMSSASLRSRIENLLAEED